MVDFAQARRIMVDNQIRPSDVTDLRVLQGLLDVPRERFVPAARQSTAYFDMDVPVNGAGRALLKPAVFGKLLQAAQIGAGDRVLDVGCATGYSAAVAGRLAKEVVALEEDEALARTARETLAAVGAEHVSVVTGPLNRGWPQGAPYAVILLEGACEVVPDTLMAQLADGGRLLAVIGTPHIGKATIYRKSGSAMSALPLFDAGAPALPGFAKPPAFVF